MGLFSKRALQVVVSVIAFGVATAWFFTAGGYEPFITLLGAFVALIGFVWSGQSDSTYRDSFRIGTTNIDLRMPWTRWQDARRVNEKVAMLEGMWVGFSKVQAIRDMAPNLPLLSGLQVVSLLGNLQEYERAEAIKILAPKIKRPIPAKQARQIMNNMVDPIRTDAIKALS